MHFERKPRGKKKLVAGEKPEPVGHVPRVARVLALAHHFDALIEHDLVKDYAEIARLSHLTRARVTQIMYLKYLAPDLQEQLVDLPMQQGKDPVSENDVRRIALIPEWAMQRRQWQSLSTARKTRDRTRNMIPAFSLHNQHGEKPSH
jgi:hypothetical protein